MCESRCHRIAFGKLFCKKYSPSDKVDRLHEQDGQHEQTTEMAASPRRQGAEPGSQAAAPPPGPSTSSTTPVAMRQKDFTPMVVQSDFRKVSGISTEIFRQIETVENDHDATTAAALEAVERRGEMLVRILDPRQMGKAASEAARSFLTLQDPKHVVHFVEIVKRPGQTLGLYIREGNGIDRSDGVFISRIALESPVYNSGCLRVGDEILAVNLVDVTRMSLDDVVIIMSIPRRLVLTTRQRRGPPGAMSPPPPRPEHKPPPVVVLKRGLDEEPLDDTASTSNSNGDRAYPHVGPSARLLATGRPLPGMADLPVHGTFPRDRERSDRDRFREREAGRYPERSAMTEEPRYYDPSMGLSRGQYGGDQYKHPTQRFKSSTLDRSGGYDMDSDLSQVATYQPPPPPSVVTEQPKPGAPQHFHPFERSYPKTLESLAERVHPFYGLQGPGAMNLGLNQQGQGQPMGRASTLGRVRMGPTTPSGAAQQMRGGRLLRSGSDQRLPVVEGSSEFYEYIMSRTNPTRTSLKPGTMHYPIGRQASADSTRVPPPRRRTSVDYASDTEASTRHQRSTLSRRPVPGYAVEESWRPPAALGIGVNPTTPTTSLAAQEASSRSNSLPRDRGGRYRRGVRFEKEPGLSGTQHDSQEDSDGAISAPEMSTSQQQQQQQQLQKVLLDQQPASFHGKLSDTPSVFTSAEYKAWLQRTPSTSAIYERLRQGRDALEAQKAAKFTFSAENLMDKTRQEPPYYAYRSHFATPKPDDSSLLAGGLGGRPPTRAGEETRGIPQPTPARTVDPRFKLIDINPAEFIKYRCERPNGITPTTSQPGSTSSVGGAPATPGPGPAPGGVEEGVSGLLWVHLLAGRSLRSTSSRAEPVRDLYCVLESDRVHKARTVIRNGDVNFDWDETFDLDLVVNKELDFLIYSWDPQLRHRLCFKGSLHLIPLLRESPVHQIALKVEPRGTLYLKLRYTEPRAAFRRTPAVRKAPPPLFGVDIETVVNREASGLGVPIIIQKCVEEVERRGMDIVGLYRLCGSATKKRILREAFERNPRLVDLSPDSVPDINVITGLLKEYLRELPEPLFTKCLYQMLVDALAVCLPDDPEGNAKLMFSILECLPKSSRTTLFLLMDHLCLVAAQSDRNKMTPQNLAICFGPVLMLHSDDVTSLDFQKPIGVLKYLVQIWPMKSARAAEAAATASLTLRRLQCPPQQQQQQQVTPTSAGVAASANPQQVIGPENVPPLPPRPAPRTLQARAGQTKVQHALGVFASAGDVIAARGEADGSPAPMADFLAALDSAAANSEDATPASSVTPSLTSPTSTSTSTTTTSASPLQPLVRGIAEGHRSRDCSEQSLGSAKNDGGACSVGNSRKENARVAANTEEDTEQEADSDLDSPN